MREALLHSQGQTDTEARAVRMHLQAQPWRLGHAGKEEGEEW